MISLRIMAYIFLGSFLSQQVLAEKFEYHYAKNDTSIYSLTANGQPDLSKIAAIAAILQITNLSENIYLVTELSTQSIAKNGILAMRAVNKELNVVMIKNDSLRKVDTREWGNFKPGATTDFDLSPDGKISAPTGKGHFADKDILAMLQLLVPKLPSGSIEIGQKWGDSLIYRSSYSGTAPVDVICKINYTYIGADKFEYAIEGKSPQNAGLHLSGKGNFNFNKSIGKLTTNNCDLELKGFVDLTQFGLPQELGANLPLVIKAQIVAKLQNRK